MKLRNLFLFPVLVLISFSAWGNVSLQAPKPLYRDPVLDGAADPLLIWNEDKNAWWMFYTNRRAKVESEEEAGAVKWVHGTKISIAESTDSGVSWDYVGNADIDLSTLYPEISELTLWAPEVVRVGPGDYRMFLTVVPGVFDDWKHPRTIVSLKSNDLMHWGDGFEIALSSDKVIDASLLELESGHWRLWYNNERDHKSIYYADSVDLKTWSEKGKAVGDQAGEGPKIFRWKGYFWLIMDVWDGLGVYRSDDAENWTRMDENLLQEPGTGLDDGVKGGHPDVVVCGDRAYLFYFTHPGRIEALKDNPYEQRRSSIQVTELFFDDGWLTCDRDQAVFVELKPEIGK